ncbi:protein SGT1 homolog B-like [Pistacia vera]|uniref:protein SGT1 homolog B-like n=1 Tax=Pistacia vera TaxID=55513 RepID=UPI0012639711|nr:protein SGT1 homolog B-like [Pistacia vera]
MATDLEKKAKEAFIDDHFQLAVDLYSQAIDINPNNAELYADRAQANIKLLNFTEAVSDANKAIKLDSSMPKAYLRKATACMKLEEYQTAKAALETGATLSPGESRFTNLIEECNERIAEECGDLQKDLSEKPPTDVSTRDAQPELNFPNQGTVIPVAKPKFRFAKGREGKDNRLRMKVIYLSRIGDNLDTLINRYSQPSYIGLNLYFKGIPAKNVSVDFGEQILSVSIDVPGEEAYHFQPRLFGKIIPTKCRYDVLSTKVEIRLAKAEPIHWTALEFTKENPVLQRVNVSSVTGSQRPTYPSSKPTKDWDKLEAQVKKEEKDEKLDGDAALNKFFQDIYADADEDTRRAMKKSFVESNGTVLSTNWKEVGSKKVEGSPPDGMEMKKWEY